MSDIEVPDADAQEQAQPVDEDAEPKLASVTSDPEAPEADALEQAQEVPADPAEDLP